LSASPGAQPVLGGTGVQAPLVSRNWPAGQGGLPVLQVRPSSLMNRLLQHVPSGIAV
jgi:hypothetical protein